MNLGSRGDDEKEESKEKTNGFAKNITPESDQPNRAYFLSFQQTYLSFVTVP